MKQIAAAIVLLFASAVSGQTPLMYVPAPADNPLKGLVPYAGNYGGRFPHSMEFNYLALSDLMTGPDTFNWQPLEKLLNDIASRRHQTVFRVWVEYPGKNEGIPAFLERGGLKVTEWLNTDTAPFPAARVRTPDYNDLNLRAALKSFVAAMGRRYDGDPRIGYITAGLIGVWGEWHTYPRTELMAGKDVQREVMDAYEAAFKKTPVLLRYPAGVDSWAHAANHTRPLGYHDDSFAWATLDTGRKEDNWYFLPAMKAAGDAAMNKWKTSPIGGEIRPDIWGQIFDDKPSHKQAQNFSDCVRETHATWLMDTGMFQKPQPPKRVDNAIKQVQRMGYEFHVMTAALKTDAAGATVTVQVRNSGVAPFYHDWKIQLAVLRDDDSVIQFIPVDWTVVGLLPDTSPTEWTVSIPSHRLPTETKRFAVRIENPLPNGLPVRFANDDRRQLDNGWLKLSE